MTLDMLFRLHETIHHYYQECEDLTDEEIKDLNEQDEALFNEMRAYSDEEVMTAWKRSNKHFMEVKSNYYKYSVIREGEKE